MQIRARPLGLLLALAACVGLAAASTALAQSEQKSKQARGTFMSFDPETDTITVREGGRDVEYKVKPEGTVLTRTMVKINGRAAYVKDLPPESNVIVYWRPDEDDPEQRFARTIDAPRIPPELLDEDDGDDEE